jgi:hypothetical protein
MNAHRFRLYRSGWSGDEAPWDDNQLWAEGVSYHSLEGQETTHVLRPMYGHAASLYRVSLTPLESAEHGWVNCRARLEVDSYHLGVVPIAWYEGAPSDWPSGVVRFPEYVGPMLPDRHWPSSTPRGVWTLAVNRDT